MMAGGAAAGDLDNDGDHDLVVITGDLSAPRILLNRGNGVFDPFDGGLPATGIYNGATLADLDGDGRLDLITGGLEGQGLRLFRNLGGARFGEITAASGIVLADDTWSAALADVDGDEVLDLALGRWARGQGRAGHYWRGLGDGRYVNADADLAISPQLAQLSYTFTPNFGDIDGDGRPDLLMAGDFGTSRVLLNRGGRLVDATTPVIDDENGMGAALADYDNDGDLDWFVSSIWDPDGVAFGNWGVTGNRLYRNRGDVSFEEVSQAAGVRQGWWGWASCFADFNNDGHLDLAHVNGMSAAPANEFHEDPTRLFIADGQGGFSEQSSLRGLIDTGQGRALVCFDADGDGDIDLFVQNNTGFSRNVGGNAGHWLTLRLQNRAPNTYAVGARISLRAGGLTQIREIQAGNNYLASNPPEAHFGLGAATAIESLSVRWPDGATQSFAPPALNQVLRLQRGQPPSPPPAIQIPSGGPAAALLIVLLLGSGLSRLRS
jgi:enediyne biosynthesis protein E4